MQPGDSLHVSTGATDERETHIEPWMYQLKAAYTAGYYKTESAEGDQLFVPWFGKTCKDCPFWSNGICQVLAEYRSPTAHTCPYFDPANHADAQSLMQQRRLDGLRQWWEWFNRRGRDR